MSEPLQHTWWRVDRKSLRHETIGSYAEPGWRSGVHGGVVYVVFSDKEASRIRTLLKAGQLPGGEPRGSPDKQSRDVVTPR